MKKIALILLALTALCASALTPKHAPKVYVDKQGVMRRSADNAEVSYYGTNYTTPFAHAYRALGYLGVDRKKAIERDVYHMKRLGLNAFRLHLWEAELTDDKGNLLQNDHLDLLDFLIAELKKRGIDIILTAQTNFGNGYPERNIDTGAFTYDYPKCGIHEDHKAQKAQANYLEQLARHVNPYTGSSYAADPDIIALEINNEPCHSGTSKQLTTYINRMVQALHKGGFTKPLLYNVSHNLGLTDGYYKADIQGTTYQWYPIGLVAGHERKGNFLPFVDDYRIPWADSIPGYDKMARVVYEFDPGDILYSYMYPAMARSFRSKGFQWITQFTYDPTDMAAYNTEYQTHFLNLAYTPAKALSMLIAAEVARSVERGADFGSYPGNTSFSHFRVDGDADLSVMNSPSKFIYTRSTTDTPIASSDSLSLVAGTGSSPLVSYPGTGAYFLDRLSPDTWRLEVMPDVILTEDPFAKPSLSRRVGEIVYARHPMTLSLPGLSDHFSYSKVAGERVPSGQANASTINVTPGVYILSSGPAQAARWTADTPYGDGTTLIGDFVAPKASAPALPKVVHTPAATALAGDSILVRARAVAAAPIDSLVIYPSDVSFWRDDNALFTMTPDPADPYGWQATIPTWPNAPEAAYSIVAYSKGTPATYPAAISGTPLDWDFPEHQPLYRVPLRSAGSPLTLLAPARDNTAVEVGSVPDGAGLWLQYIDPKPLAAPYYRLHFTPKQTTDATVKTYIAPGIDAATDLNSMKQIEVTFASIPEGTDRLQLTLIAADGIGYTAEAPITGTRLSIPLSSMQESAYPLIPAAYPSFMATHSPDTRTGKPLSLSAAESLLLTFPGLTPDTPVTIPLQAIRLLP